jgi:hypothetical protein
MEWSFFLEEAVFLEASYQSRRHGMYHSSITLSWTRVVSTGSLGHCEDRGGLDCGGMERFADSTIASRLPKVKAISEPLKTKLRPNCHMASSVPLSLSSQSLQRSVSSLVQLSLIHTESILMSVCCLTLLVHELLGMTLITPPLKTASTLSCSRFPEISAQLYTTIYHGTKD